MRSRVIGLSLSLGTIFAGYHYLSEEQMEKWYNQLNTKFPEKNASPAGSLSQYILHKIYNGINTQNNLERKKVIITIQEILFYLYNKLHR